MCVFALKVQKAKVEHFHAYAQAKAQQAYGQHDVPQDTPEVQIAKFQHLTAVAQAQAEHQQSGHEEVYNGGYDGSYNGYGYEQQGHDYHY